MIRESLSFELWERGNRLKICSCWNCKSNQPEYEVIKMVDFAFCRKRSCTIMKISKFWETTKLWWVARDGDKVNRKELSVRGRIFDDLSRFLLDGNPQHCELIIGPLKNFLKKGQDCWVKIGMFTSENSAHACLRSSWSHPTDSRPMPTSTDNSIISVATSPRAPTSFSRCSGCTRWTVARYVSCKFVFHFPSTCTELLNAAVCFEIFIDKETKVKLSSRCCRA